MQAYQSEGFISWYTWTVELDVGSVAPDRRDQMWRQWAQDITAKRVAN